MDEVDENIKIEGVNSKLCTKCGELKLFDKFSKKKDKKYGISSQCKNCIKENNKRDKDKNKKRRSEYNQKNRDKINLKRRMYRENNKEKIKEYDKKYRENSKEARKIEIKKYFEVEKSNVDWSKYNGCDSSSSREAYVSFCEYISKKGYELIGKYVNTTTKVEISYNCTHPNQKVLPSNIKNNTSCNMCRYEEQSKKMSGEGSPRYIDGRTPLSKYLRSKTLPWMNRIRKQQNNMCAITGKIDKSNAVHHVYGFSFIFNEVMGTLGYEIYEEVSRYTEEELRLMTNLTRKLHIQNVDGVVLCEEVHQEFHNIYGYGDNTLEQWEEFYNMKKAM